jgi:hypothetical protein
MTLKTIKDVIFNQPSGGSFGKVVSEEKIFRN